MSEQQAILHCPFCGHEAKAYASHYANIGEHWVICLSPNCGGKTHWWTSREQAIAAWNKRATGYYCTKCASPLYAMNGDETCPKCGVITSGYYQVEPIAEQPPTETTVYCQGCREKDADLAALRAKLTATQDYRAQAEAEMDRLNGIVGKQNTELVPLRKLREAVMAYKGHRHPAMTEVWLALAACDEASAPTGDDA